VLGRELTKKFEEVARLRLGEAGRWLDADTHREQGEYVVVLAPGEERARDAALAAEDVLALLLESLPASEAARVAAKITGAPKNALYRKALEKPKPRAK
jgi:16S rRNA (cytidine1402-2'-O)-methyltransferase